MPLLGETRVGAFVIVDHEISYVLVHTHSAGVGVKPTLV